MSTNHSYPRTAQSGHRSLRTRLELTSIAAVLLTSACVSGVSSSETTGAGGTSNVAHGGSAGSLLGVSGSNSSGGSVALGGSGSIAGGSTSVGGSPVIQGGSGGSTSSGGSGGQTGCGLPAWQMGTHYPTDTKVTKNGKAYVAVHENDGLDPEVSTWYWAPSSCGTGAGGTGAGGGSGGGTVVDPNDPKLNVRGGTVPEAYLPWLRKAAARCPFVDAVHLAAQIDQESRWDPNARSSIGAQGLTQFLPNTWGAYGVDADGDGKADPLNPADSILSQANYMCELVGELGAGLTWTTLLWAYNAGPNATKAAGGKAPTQEAADYSYLILTDLVPKYTP